MKNQKISKIKSFLPVFTGFYDTLFSPESDIDDLISEGELDKDFDWENFDNAGFERDTIIECCAVLEQWLPKESGISKIEFERVVSPKEYNYVNDAADVTFHVDIKKFSKWFNNYLKMNAGKFEEYLERYKSRDGFISYYSHDIDDWRSNTNNFSDFTKKPLASYSMRDFGTHAFGALLNFYFHNEKNDAALSLYYAVHDNICVNNYIKPK